MKSFHVNLGHYFARPNESWYSILRRCLIVNPGISITAIEQNLRKIYPTLESTIQRLRHLQLNPDLNKANDYPDTRLSFQRQCPRCAKQLYHSDIYTLPWLTYCPVHLCRLTTNCPKCKKPWPNALDIHRRDCPVCGSALLCFRKKTLLSVMKQESYKRINDIYQILDRYHTAPSINIYDLNDPLGNQGTWWENVPLTSVKFPSFMARCYPGFTELKLDLLKIKSYKIHCKSTIMSLNAPREARSGAHHLSLVLGKKSYGHNNLVLMQQLKSDYIVLQYIVNWITRHTSNKHTVHLSGYQYSTYGYFMRSPDPCPYCMAFSLWLFQIMAKKYRGNSAGGMDDYDFCEEGGLLDFYYGCSPGITIDNNSRLDTSPTFSLWFYRRGLEISFLHILQFTFDLLRQLSLSHESKGPHYRSPFNNSIFSDQYYYANVIKDRLYFYYEHEHPLEFSHFDKIPKINTVCGAFQQHHSRNGYYYPKTISCKISTNGLTFDEFLQLFEGYGKFIKNSRHGKPDENGSVAGFFGE